MSNIEQIKYMKKRMKDTFNKEQDAKKRERQKNDAIYKSFQSVTDIPPLVCMKDALKEVRKKDYITHDEGYARLTGGYKPMRNMKTK